MLALAPPLPVPRTRALTLPLALPQATREAPLVVLAVLEKILLAEKGALNVCRAEARGVLVELPIAVLLLQADELPLCETRKEAVRVTDGESEREGDPDKEGVPLTDTLLEEECVTLPLLLLLPLPLSLTNVLRLTLPLMLPLTLLLSLPLPLADSRLLTLAGCETFAGNDVAVELGVSTVGDTSADAVKKSVDLALLVDFNEAAALREPAIEPLGAPEAVLFAELFALRVDESEDRAVFVMLTAPVALLFSVSLPRREAVAEYRTEGVSGGDAERRGEKEAEGDVVPLNEASLDGDELTEALSAAESAGVRDSEGGADSESDSEAL